MQTIGPISIGKWLLLSRLVFGLGFPSGRMIKRLLTLNVLAELSWSGIQIWVTSRLGSGGFPPRRSG
ncbi:hypothetical protein IQ266_18405 [filamentous cyanobacterium LEGE 11480]|uniref:Uncharacterized protein n=1 Tax=Romeriopsis navalis LEGE 11480 TaxID=2777977 RepID=A0A928VN82_9CYAN|nr:hypothetical protein [Romeriopsis navalis]MBE9031708.1 hypothetical protein [Romeriopsis navalis LEGE 11480]